MAGNSREIAAIAISKNNQLKRSVCVITAAAFFINILSSDLASAVNASSLVTGGDPRVSALSNEGKELHPETFVLPEHLGSVTYRHTADKASGTVIHIQDAHCNYACQKKVSEIIGYLNGEYGISAVNLEGGAGGYDLSVLTRIQDRGIREKVTDHFVSEGLVNGAEYFAVNNPGKIRLWGVEDTKLYAGNLGAYRNSLRYKDEVTSHLKALNSVFSDLIAKMYSKDLLEFELRYRAYKSGNAEFREYLDFLIETAERAGVDSSSIPNIELLGFTLAEEENVDFKNADRQRAELLGVLQKTLSDRLIRELIANTAGFRTGSITQKDFYADLTAKAKLAGVPMESFPELKRYISYVSMYDDVDRSAVMREMALAEDLIKDSLCRSGEERELSVLSKNLALLESLFNASLTKEDYKYYKANKRSFDAGNFISFIDRYAFVHKITARPDDNVRDLDRYREDMENFYGHSFERDMAFIENMDLRKAHEEEKVGGPAGILVTGGFHTENLVDLLKEHGFSYVSIVPKFEICGEHKNRYFALLGGDQDSVMGRLRDFTYSALAIASFLNENINVGGLPGEEFRRVSFDLLSKWQEGKISYPEKSGMLINAGDQYFAIDWDGNTVFRGLRDAADASGVIEDDFMVVQLNTMIAKAEILKALNASGGKITFREYMEMCLYGRGGYYSSGTVKFGDYFVTSPSFMSPHFGEAVAQQLSYMWEHMGKPLNFRVVEMGAGNGVLAFDILSWAESLKDKKFFEAINYEIVEISPELIKAQKNKLGPYPSKVRWKEASVRDLPVEEIENGVFLSNELPDAFPVHKVSMRNGKLQEAYVEYNQENGTFNEVWDDLSSEYRADIEAYLERVRKEEGHESLAGLMGPRRDIDGGDLPPRVIPVNLEAGKWLEKMASKLKRGYLITIDYSPATMLYSGGLHDIRVYGPGARGKPGDAYVDPGGRDITSDVYFPGLIERGEELGLTSHGSTPQATFLRKFGVPENVLSRLDNSRNFFVLVQSKGMGDALPHRSASPEAGTENPVSLLGISPWMALGILPQLAEAEIYDIGAISAVLGAAFVVFVVFRLISYFRTFDFRSMSSKDRRRIAAEGERGLTEAEIRKKLNENFEKINGAHLDVSVSMQKLEFMRSDLHRILSNEVPDAASYPGENVKSLRKKLANIRQQIESAQRISAKALIEVRSIAENIEKSKRDGLQKMVWDAEDRDKAISDLWIAALIQIDEALQLGDDAERSIKDRRELAGRLALALGSHLEQLKSFDKELDRLLDRVFLAGGGLPDGIIELLDTLSTTRLRVDLVSHRLKTFLSYIEPESEELKEAQKLLSEADEVLKGYRRDAVNVPVVFAPDGDFEFTVKNTTPWISFLTDTIFSSDAGYEEMVMGVYEKALGEMTELMQQMPEIVKSDIMDPDLLADGTLRLLGSDSNALSEDEKALYLKYLNLRSFFRWAYSEKKVVENRKIEKKLLLTLRTIPGVTFDIFGGLLTANASLMSSQEEKVLELMREYNLLVRKRRIKEIEEELQEIEFSGEDPGESSDGYFDGDSDGYSGEDSDYNPDDHFGVSSYEKNRQREDRMADLEKELAWLKLLTSPPDTQSQGGIAPASLMSIDKKDAGLRSVAREEILFRGLTWAVMSFIDGWGLLIAGGINLAFVFGHWNNVKKMYGQRPPPFALLNVFIVPLAVAVINVLFLPAFISAPLGLSLFLYLASSVAVHLALNTLAFAWNDFVRHRIGRSDHLIAPASLPSQGEPEDEPREDQAARKLEEVRAYFGTLAKRDELERSENLLEEILKKPSIQKIMVVGDGLGTLPVLLAAAGKDVTFVDLSTPKVDLMKHYAGKFSLEERLKTIKGEIGSLEITEDLKGKFDLITFIDLVGGVPKGKIENWVSKAAELLPDEKPGYIVIDEKDIVHDPGRKREARTRLSGYFRKKFKLFLLSTKDFQGSYNNWKELESDLTNLFYEVTKRTSGHGPPAGGDAADGAIASGLSQDEINNIKNQKVLPSSKDGDIVRAMGILTEAGEAALAALGNYEQQAAPSDKEKIEKVRYLLEDPISGFSFFRARVDGPEKYLLGYKNALAVNIINFLDTVDRQKTEGKRFLVAEYILHEALETIDGLDHASIIKMTSRIFYPDGVFTANKETPLGKQLRRFINVHALLAGGKLDTAAMEDLEALEKTLELYPEKEYQDLSLAVVKAKIDSRLAKNVLAEVMKGDYPRVVIIPVKADLLLYDGSEYTAVRNGVKRKLKRNYGVNVTALYYKTGDESSLEDAVNAAKSIPGFSTHERSGLLVYADADPEDAAGIRARLVEALGDDLKGRLAGVVPGHFDIENDMERYSIVGLVIGALGMIDAELHDKLGNGDMANKIAGEVISYMKRLVDNPEDLTPVEGDNIAVIKALLSGDKTLKIKKINFEEIRDFFESERAVLESL